MSENFKSGLDSHAHQLKFYFFTEEVLLLKWWKNIPWYHLSSALFPHHSKYQEQSCTTGHTALGTSLKLAHNTPEHQGWFFFVMQATVHQQLDWNNQSLSHMANIEQLNRKWLNSFQLLFGKSIWQLQLFIIIFVQLYWGSLSSFAWLHSLSPIVLHSCGKVLGWGRLLFCEKRTETSPMSDKASLSWLQDRPTSGQGWALSSRGIDSGVVYLR